MKASLLWSDRALRDLDAVLAYLAERSPQAARRFGEAVLLRVRRLERFPESGRRVSEFPAAEPALRELILNDYRLVYQLRGRRVEILTIFHGRRRFQKSFMH